MQQATHRTAGSLGTPRQGNPQQPAAYCEKREHIPDAEQADPVKRQEAPQAVTIYDQLLEYDPCHEEADKNGGFHQKR